MKAVVRGAAVAAVLVLALTGCEESIPAAGSEKAPGVPGEVQPNAPKAVPLDSTGLMNALPVESEVSDVFTGGDPFAGQGPEAVDHCAKEAGMACTGLIAIGGKDMEARGGSDGTRVEFRLYSFGTEEQAGAVMKGLAAAKLKSSAEYGEPAKPVTLVTVADETVASADDSSADVVLRIGTVVAHIDANDTETAGLEHASNVQVERVRMVAAGRTPGY
ncbi:hypothetical protein GCM10017674_23020 [Streptomyces gardneri]|uniref:Lipoprotein n=1 Tax=Streptomyces gardneri TaxID=66892 RepID=A0A4Y3RV50_9ACTN|nr:hypothetical protein SGA01_67840 [Streptomyces gardneri]GHG93097.1 hypothetical protein GCM10017674_23020 [Streptomyces gardneri]